VKASRRRARQIGNGGTHTLAEWQDKCALLGNVCFYCGEAKPLGPDHKVPLSRGGGDAIENILPACIECNVRKGARTAREYLAAAA
jgi:5-methylcytosine-specific restriction endonuclease McrA